MDTSLSKQAKIAFNIINYSAMAKTRSLNAINLAKDKKFNEAKKEIKKAKKDLGKASKQHVPLVQYEAGNNPINVSLLLMHAEDQMLTTETLIILANEIIEIYKKLLN